MASVCKIKQKNIQAKTTKKKSDGKEQKLKEKIKILGMRWNSLTAMDTEGRCMAPHSKALAANLHWNMQR